MVSIYTTKLKLSLACRTKTGNNHFCIYMDTKNFLNKIIDVDVGFSFCLVTFLKLNLDQISQGTEKYFQLKTSFCQFANMASSSLKKMLIFIILSEILRKMFIFPIFQHFVVNCCNLVLYNAIIIIGRWYAYWVADVIANLERYHCGRW